MEIKKLFKIIYKVARKEKMDVYVVGGYVRDGLLSVIARSDSDEVIPKKMGIVSLTPFAHNDVKDIDFVVQGSGLEFAKKFDEEMKQEGSLVEFPEFDTARYVFVEGIRNKEKGINEMIELEFAGARSEKYDEKSRKPKVKSTSLEEDLQRRDFTVNAMCQKIMTGGKLGKIVDLFGGQKDLQSKTLRTPLDPDATFSDDPLRMMRAARFASQLGFTIEANTYTALEKNASRLKIISAERVKEELFKIFATQKPSIGLRILYDSGLLKIFLPEVCDLKGAEEIFGQQHKDVLEHTFKVVDNLAERTDKVLLRLAGLFHDIAKPATKKFIRGRGWSFDMHEHLGKKMVKDIGRRLRFSLDEIKYIGKLVRWHQQPIGLMDEGITDSAIRRLVVNLGDNLDDLLKLCRSDITTGNPLKLKRRLANYDYLERRIQEVQEKDKLRAFQSPFRGDEIMQACGLKPGPTVGKIKKALEEAILDGIIPNDYEATKKYFIEIKDDYLSKAEMWEKVKKCEN